MKKSKSKRTAWRAKGGDTSLLRLAFKMVKVMFMCKVSHGVISGWQSWIDKVLQAKSIYDQCTFAGGLLTMINGWLNPACRRVMDNVPFITGADAAWAELQKNLGVPEVLDKCQLIIYVVCIVKALQASYRYMCEFMKKGTDEEVIATIDKNIRDPQALQAAIQAALLAVGARRRSSSPSAERAAGVLPPSVPVYTDDTPMEEVRSPRALHDMNEMQERMFNEIDDAADSQASVYYSCASQGGCLRP